MPKLKLFLTSIYLLISYTIILGQNQVKIDPTIQRYIGDVSELDRTKFFNMHATWGDKNITDDEYNHFTQQLNAGFGRGFWGPFSWAKSNQGGVGMYPSEAEAKSRGNGTINWNKSQSYWWRRSNRNIVTEHPQDVVRWSIDTASAANWASNYFKYFFTDEDRPEYFEVMNEPFVHAGDDVFKEEQPDAQLMRERMADWYAAIGRRFMATPELENVNVIGYSSAWPSMEKSDFEHWNTRQKMFMDRAGEFMDAFAIHFYDGINVTGADSRRSGSNTEAILDLVETYSNKKWGVVKFFAISEFGGIEKGYGDNYSDIRSAQSIKSINHILFSLLERENKMAISIPFIGAKATWHITAANSYQPYGSVLWRPKTIGIPLDDNTEWVFTSKVYFYELWQNVKGKRVYFESENPDIQVQAFADGSKLYIALDNLDEMDHDVDLSLLKLSDKINGVVKRSLKIWKDQNPEFLVENLNSLPEKITLIPSETVVFECTLESEIEFEKRIKSTKYYSLSHLQTIQGLNQTFEIDNVATGSDSGLAFLRMSIGRKHYNSKKPVVSINGNDVVVPDNWAGGDQASREDFFGTIVIPVPIDLIQTNNSIDIHFPDSGGRVSSVVLQVELIDTKTSVIEYQNKEIDFGIYPNPATSRLIIIGIEEETVFDIYDMFGKLVKNGKAYPQKSIDISDLNGGMYIFSIENKGFKKLLVQ